MVYHISVAVIRFSYISSCKTADAEHGARAAHTRSLATAMDFHTACEKAKAFTKKPTNAEFLEFYGLYKQCTVGDCNIDKPGALDVKAKAKYEAWNQHKGMSQDAAKKAYIAVYEKYAPKYA